MPATILAAIAFTFGSSDGIQNSASRYLRTSAGTGAPLSASGATLRSRARAWNVTARRGLPETPLHSAYR